MTMKQDLAVSKLVENHGNVSKSMLEAGYSPQTAKNPSNLTKSKAYKSLYAPLLKEHKVTINQYIKNIGDAMVAEKQNNFTGEVTPDISTRLAGNKQAERFLFKDQPTPTKEGISAEDMQALANESDEVILQQVVFSKLQT